MKLMPIIVKRRGATPAVNPQPLRFAAVSNRIQEQFKNFTAAQSILRGNNPFSLGSGSGSELVVSMPNWSLVQRSGVTSNANAITILGMAVTLNGVTVPVTWDNGSPTKVLAVNSTDIKCDPMPPASFGLSSFPRGMAGSVKFEMTCANPATGTFCASGLSAASQYCVTYDPTKISYTNSITSSGSVTAFTFINGGSASDQTTQAYVPQPIILCRFVSGDPPVVGTVGDSICEGLGDTPVSTVNVLGLARALVPDMTTPANGTAGMNFGCSGSAAGDWFLISPSLLHAYVKYANVFVDNYGTNGQDFTGDQAIHALLRANGAKRIIRTSLCPRTTSLLAITALTSVGTTATATIPDTSKLVNGTVYPITGSAVAAYNGSYAITVINATQFTYTFAGGTSPAGGTPFINDQFRTEFYQDYIALWGPGGSVDNYETAEKALVAADFTYYQFMAIRASAHNPPGDYWKWNYDGGATSFTPEGVHPRTVGYELNVAATSNVIITPSGSTTGSLRSIIASLYPTP